MKPGKFLHAAMVTISILTLAVVFAIIMVLFVGCGAVSKSNVITKRDSIAVARTDSGRITRNESSAKSSEDWFKEWLMIQPSKGSNANIKAVSPADNTASTILPEHFYHTNQPIYMYREGGSKSSEQITINLDSFWRAKQDSIAIAQSESVEKKERKGIGLWDIIGACVATAAIVLIINRLSARYKIVKSNG